jgi:DNA-binding transcriptional ArsR family regulator
VSDTFAVIAEPWRRRILDRLLTSESSVSELVMTLGLSQSAVSKHLRVLRESGLVTSRIDAQRRIYTLDSRPLVELDGWLESYRQGWNQRIDALAIHLDQQSPTEEP